MWDKIKDAFIDHIIAIVVTGVTTGALAAWGALTISDDRLEKRVEALEDQMKAKGAPASFWEERCAKLIDEYAAASDSFHEGRIERAMEKAGCKPE
jgi:hypothetical protein